ncbi:MAG: peptide chain release factor 1 [Nitrospinae bacterium RIFCSPLOWO2_12_FULL_45_22]|nr:MAG: peptide chain release factor 1 [Nitrospinae bacterium RIFCSPLOWO2_12_FULL_45_22]
MLNRLEQLEKRHQELTERLSNPQILSQQGEYQKLVKEHGEHSKLLQVFAQYKRALEDIAKDEVIIKDEAEDKELRDLARQDQEELEKKRVELEQKIRLLLIPKDPKDDKNIILEIRAGTGGEEAALFVADLFRMYGKYAEKERWRVQMINAHPTGIGGFKEAIASIEGKGVYSKLKHESGTHRVQRIPRTETSGRIHTSAVTVAVLPEAEEIEVEINPEDIRVDVFRSSGPGGQSVNTTDSAVRITHIPTGIVVSCQDEKSQHKNKAKAMKVLRARLLDKLEQEQQAEISRNRKNQIGSGDRSERVRTYNFPQNRLTDHRIGLTLYKLDSIMEGELDELVEAMTLLDQEHALAQVE